jgi:hypothetical protein
MGLDINTLTLVAMQAAAHISLVAPQSSNAPSFLPLKHSAPSDFPASASQTPCKKACIHCFWCGHSGHLPGDCSAETTSAGKPIAPLATSVKSCHALTASNKTLLLQLGPFFLLLFWHQLHQLSWMQCVWRTWAWSQQLQPMSLTPDLDATLSVHGSPKQEDNSNIGRATWCRGQMTLNSCSNGTTHKSRYYHTEITSPTSTQCYR